MPTSRYGWTRLPNGEVPHIPLFLPLRPLEVWGGTRDRVVMRRMVYALPHRHPTPIWFTLIIIIQERVVVVVVATKVVPTTTGTSSILISTRTPCLGGRILVLLLR
jgi:hypothetical protein